MVLPQSLSDNRIQVFLLIVTKIGADSIENLHLRQSLYSVLAGLDRTAAETG